MIIIIYKMSNSENHGVCKCQHHQLTLKALHKQRRPNMNTNVTICKSKQIKRKKNKDSCKHYDGPVFNRDRCHATPTFILPSEKNEYQLTTKELLQDHERKVKEQQEGNDDMFVPKPRSKSLYCSVCRQNYEEYIDHIKSFDHRANIKQSIFNNHILELQRKFKTSDHPQNSLSLNQTGQDEDEVEIIGYRGRKISKTIHIIDDQPQVPYYPFVNQPSYINHNPMPQANLFFPQQMKFPEYEFSPCRNFYPPITNMSAGHYYPFFGDGRPSLFPFYCMQYPGYNMEIAQQNY